MTCRELLQMLQSKLDTESQLQELDISMSPVYSKNDDKDCVARLLVPIENKTRVIEINVKELCVYEGLSQL